MSDPTPQPELKTYYGNCHCGAFKFSVNLPELKLVNECNCSICFKKGYKWVFPGAGQFNIEKGYGVLKDYEFGPCSMAHKVCIFSTRRCSILLYLTRVVLSNLWHWCSRL